MSVTGSNRGHYPLAVRAKTFDSTVEVARHVDIGFGKRRFVMVALLPLFVIMVIVTVMVVVMVAMFGAGRFVLCAARHQQAQCQQCTRRREGSLGQQVSANVNGHNESGVERKGSRTG
jgi:hypothetical protein